MELEQVHKPGTFLAWWNSLTPSQQRHESAKAHWRTLERIDNMRRRLEEDGPQPEVPPAELERVIAEVRAGIQRVIDE